MQDGSSIAGGERRFTLLVNPSAGAGRAETKLPRVQAELDARSIDYELTVTHSLEHGCDEARRAVAEGSIPVVMSGDGLIGKVGGVLAGGETPLGVIPGGRGNDLARVVGIPTEPEAAVAVLLEGHTRAIDIGEANGERFICIASCGFDSDANRIANETRWVKGQLVYAYAAIRALIQWRPARFTLTLDGEQRSFSGFSVAVANSKAYGGGMFVAPDAELEDGLLDVITTSGSSKLAFVRGLPGVFKGKHVERPEVDCARAAEVRIEADRPFAVYADGEQITDLPATIRLLAGSLRLIAPAPAASP